MSFREVYCSKCPKFGKKKGKNPQVCPFTGLSYAFLIIPDARPYFLE